MDNIHSNWDDTEAVVMAMELSDPNQPYSCSAWGNQFDNSEPLIVNGGSPYYHWWGMFEATYVPANAFIDHKMKVHHKTNSLSYATANSKIEEMLEDCGECRVGDEVIEDFSEGNQSYQEFCCETFGGIYYDSGTLEWDEYYCVDSEATWVSLCGVCTGTTDSDGDGTADECDDCYNSPGDINEDMVVDILDVVNVVNIVLNGGINSPNYTECQLLNANYNEDSLINVLDIIQIINAILGQGLNSLHIDESPPAYVSLDVVNVVNIVLSGGINSPNYTECQLSNANYNEDSLINVLDIIQIINTILGQGLNSMHADINSPAFVSLNSIDNNLILNISSSTDFTGIEITFNSNNLLPVSIDNNRSDIQVSTDLYNDTQKILIFSLENLPFDGNSINVSINGCSTLGPEDIDIVVASRTGGSVSVAHTAVEVDSFTMKSLYPNPFNPVTKLSYDVEKAGNLRISVYNILGQEVAELYNDYQSFGSHSLIWNASNMASGVYYIKLNLNGQSETNKVMLMK